MIHLNNIGLSFGAQILFSNLSWHIKAGKKTGLVGPNGTGKTTLLDIIVGNLSLDTGTVSIAKSAKIGYLPQQVKEGSLELSVIDEALSAFDDISRLHDEGDEIHKQLESHSDHTSEQYLSLLTKFDDVAHRLKALDAHNIKHKTEKLLEGLGFETHELELPLKTFSGGWRMRVALAKLLVRQPDVLLLDEPTNHLDIESIDWLEEYLKNYKGAVVLVSHDQYFLNKMVDNIAELSMGAVTEYAGNYSFYLEERTSRRQLQRSAYENQQKEIRQTEHFIERFRSKNTKARQVQSRIKALEKMKLIPEPLSDEQAIQIKFPEPSRSGKDVLGLSTFSKSYANNDGSVNEVFNSAPPLLIERGDKIALIGKNGAGKSTLARILSGAEPFDGERKLGHEVRFTFFDQFEADNLDPKKNILEELEQVEGSSSETRLRSLLGAFLFTENDVFKPIKVLSGGEKSRVALAKSLLHPANFMILDEPTNHLDIQSRAILAESLNQFNGTFVVISHDRSFLDKIVNKVWYVSGGNVHIHLGNYSDFLWRLKHKKTEYSANRQNNYTGNTNGGINGEPSVGKAKSKEQKRFEAEERNARYREIMELGIENIDKVDDWSPFTVKQMKNVLVKVEKQINKTEENISELKSLIQDPELFKDKERSYEVTTSFNDMENHLAKLLGAWEILSDHIELKYNSSA